MSRASKLLETMSLHEVDLLRDRLVVESINDKNIFKAIVMAGGPGSGKSFVLDNVIGKEGPVSGLGAMVINSDSFVEYLFPKFHLPLTFDKSRPEQYAQQMEVRELATQLAKNRALQWLNGMLPVVLDGTGKNYEKIVSQTTTLRQLGYDVSMIFVNTTIEVAQARNLKRDRKVDPEEVHKMWTLVQSNLGKFQKFFTRDFHIIDNSEALEGPELKRFEADLFRLGKSLLGSPVQNPIGKSVIAALHATGGKYLQDLEDVKIDLRL